QRRLTTRKHRGKLLTTNTPEQIATAQRGRAAVCQALQHLIAHLVTMTIIDLLKVVEVEQQKGQRTGIFARLLKLALGAFEKVSAVAALGQHIGGSQAVQLAFELLLLGNVFGNADDDMRLARCTFTTDKTLIAKPAQL